MWQELASFIQRKANQNLSNSGDNKDNIIQAVKHGDENLVRKLLEEDSGKILLKCAETRELISKDYLYRNLVENLRIIRPNK